MADTIEGPWEEVMARADEFSGRRVRITFLREPATSDLNHPFFRLTPEEWERRVDEHATRYQAIPPLPPGAFERESLYGEDD